MSAALPRPPYFRLITFTLILGLLIFGLRHFKPHWVYPDIIFVLAFFLFVFLCSYFIIQLSFTRRDPRQAVSIHLAAMVARLILCVIAAFVFIKFDPAFSDLFVVNFLVVYLFYLGFEIYSLLSNLRPHLRS